VTTPDWTVVVPVKGTADAKSRLAAGPELARAIALDTVAAVVAAPSVRRVIVVTVAAASDEFERIGVEMVIDRGLGLRAAIDDGIAAGGEHRVAVLLGDLPALHPAELDAALALAVAHPLAFVSDADGEGTSLITALRASDHRPAFGGGSRWAHVAAGYKELAVSVDSGLRRDVDTRAQLAFLAADGRLGSRTTFALVGSPVDPAESVA
jgi:2-phospho-L-lactate guanylyltransferase